jgi:hypothetical protein
MSAAANPIDFATLARAWPALTKGEPIMIDGDQAAADGRVEERLLDLSITEAGFTSRALVKREQVETRRIEVRSGEGGGVVLAEFGRGNLPRNVIHLGPVEAGHIARLMLKAVSGS